MEMLDKPQLGLTDFQLRLNYQRALEGELARTIGTIKGVQRAQVHLVLPESSPLRKLDRPAEAAVVLTLQPGFTLASDAVQGITYIVSNSVQQLPSDHVAVMDSEGHLLSVPADQGSPAGLSTRQLDMQRSVETHLASKAEGLLATVVGPGAARVQVAAQLNFEQVDRTVESYNPDGAVLSNEQRAETVGDTLDGMSGANSTIINNSYQNSRTLEKIVGSVGGIQRLTVAVLVDEKALSRGGAEGKDARMQNIEALVKNAIGLDSARGDRISVAAIPFEEAVLNAVGGDSAQAPGTPVLVVVERFSRPAIGLIGILAAFVLALKVLRPAPGQSAPQTARGGSRSIKEPEPEVELPPVVVPALAAVTTKLKNQVQLESSQSPETTARVVRAWLKAD